MGHSQSASAEANDGGLLSSEEREAVASFLRSCGDGAEGFCAAVDLDSDGAPGFAKGLWSLWTDQGARALTERVLCAGVAGCCRGPSRNAFLSLFSLGQHLCEPGEAAAETMTQQQLRELLRCCYAMARKTSCAQQDGDVASGLSVDVEDVAAFFERLAAEAFSESAILGSADGHAMDLEAFKVWCNGHCAALPQCFSTWCQQTFLRGLPPPASFHSFALPQLDSESRILGEVPGGEVSLFWLAVTTKEVGGSFTRLYANYSDGLSFPRLSHIILGWSGPTMLLIRSQPQAPELTAEQILAGVEEGSQGPAVASTFGAFLTCPWRESNALYGDRRGFLFRAAPEFQLMRPKAGAEPSQYYNTRSYTLPHGIGIGGRIAAERTSNGKADASFRIFLPDTLEGCTASPRCAAFATGRLAARSTFDVGALEVWGVSANAEERELALAARGEARALRQKQIDRARKVDKAAFLGNDFDRETLLGKTFATGARGVDKDREELLQRFKKGGP